MRTLRTREWAQLYHSVWKPRIAHLSKEQRAKLVRGCMGKAIYDDDAEAQLLIATLPLREGFNAKGSHAESQRIFFERFA